VKFLCEQCKAKYQIADEKAVGKTVRMKCRKCGHLIEVRAAVTETSVAAPPAERPAVPAPAPAPAPAPGMATAPVTAPPIVPGPVDPGPPASATLIAAAPIAPAPAKPIPRPASALEGAFKTAVQSTQQEPPPAAARLPAREDEPSTPFDMADLSANDEWYVAINGVPVGPIRVAEVRRKAALGAVTEDSLVWQEGLDEWRPLRTFAELASSVREAMTRMSRPPPGEVRASVPPPPPARGLRASGASAAQPSPRALPPARSSLGPSSAPLPAPAAQTAAAARSNVVPIMSRLATAEKLDPMLVQRASPVPGLPAPQPPTPAVEAVSPSIVPDPFAAGPAAASLSIPAASMVAAAIAPAGSMSSAPPPSAKPVSWMGRAFVVMACAFGITAALAMVDQLLLKRPPPIVGDTTSPTSSVPAPGVPSSAPTATAAATDAVEHASPLATAAPTRATAVARPAATAASTATAATTAAAMATATSTGRSLDLHSLTQSGAGITPTDEPGSDIPKSTGGGSVTGEQVSQVVALHRPGVSRGCWDRNPTAKPAVNVTVSLTVAADGSAQNVSSVGDDASVAKCIENDVRNWRFPASGAPQKIAIPFKFVRQ
jgi:predicted Zn finger-like uncharacterized protein